MFACVCECVCVCVRMRERDCFSFFFPDEKCLHRRAHFKNKESIFFVSIVYAEPVMDSIC